MWAFKKASSLNKCYIFVNLNTKKKDGKLETFMWG